MEFMSFMNMFFNMIGYTLATIIVPIWVYTLVLKYGSKVFKKLFKK